MVDYSGKWLTTFGPMELAQKGKRVQGIYVAGVEECSIDGTLAGDRLTFSYREPTATGEGWFELTRNGQAFVGRWRPDGEGRWGDWVGERVGFDGVWETDYGK